jgi:3-hydroxyethyl bacteriochlorophyllide a dehydrogenase
VVVPGARLLPIPDSLGEQGVLMALAATAHHAIAGDGKSCPDLVVGHGVLGRLLARVTMALGAQPPVVWETNPKRAGGASGYEVLAPDADPKNDYPVVCDVSGDSSLLDRLVVRLAHGGEIVLAGFYEAPLSFEFPPAFMREMRLRVAAEFRENDLQAVRALIEIGALSLDGLITHRYDASEAASAYETAFEDPSCLKLVLDWRGLHG